MQLRELRYTGSRDWPPIKQWLAGRENPQDKVEQQVREILDTVRRDGDKALVDYTRRFDCPDFSMHALRVPRDQIEAAARSMTEEDLAIFAEAADNIRRFHTLQVQRSWWTDTQPGVVLGQLVRPVDRVGLYVPGGQGGETPLLSSLLMTAIPAQVAGVRSIAVVSPPRRDASLNPSILAAAHLLGLDEIYAVGSAWAVAALGMGTQTIQPVDVIAGPGNIYVTTAKRLLLGQVGLDMIAGPSEVSILATCPPADPQDIAADLLSQAEHDPLASALCISPDAGLLSAVKEALKNQLESLPRNEIARDSLAQWGALIHVPDLETGLELVNHLAPEHLEVIANDPWELLPAIRNAGAVFLGPHSAEPLGDYFAGTNHVLPTMGTARFSQALSVETFTKKTSLLAATAEYAWATAGKIARMARLEGLEAHARSAERRSRK